MKTYSEFKPTGFDCAGLGLEDRQDWLVSPCGTNRDADILTRSNWCVVNAELDKLDPEGDDHEVHSFGHWACGHFDIVLVRPGSACAKACEKWENALSDYPVASENDFADLQAEEAFACWESMSLRERVRLCSDAGISIMAARRNSIPDSEYIWERLTAS